MAPVLIAQYAGQEPQYFLGDALGSVRQLLEASGTRSLYQSFDPFGKLSSRYGSGSSPYGFAGEWTDPSGLQFLRARYYDPVQGRFITRDAWPGTPWQPASLNAYSYSGNNPVNYADPSGHVPLLVTTLIGAGIAASVDFGWQVFDNVQSGQSYDKAFVNVDSAEIVGAAVAGGIAGGTLGLGTAALATIGGTAATTGLIAVPVAAVAGGVGNALGGQAGAMVEAGIRQIGNSQFDKNAFYSDAFDAGFLNADDFLWDLGSGAILGAGGQFFSNLTVPSASARYRFYTQYKDLEGNIIQVPQNTPVRLPGEPEKPILKGYIAGFMHETSDWGQEIISQGADRCRTRAR